MCVLREWQQGNPCGLNSQGLSWYKGPGFSDRPTQRSWALLPVPLCPLLRWVQRKEIYVRWLHWEREETVGSSSPVSTLPTLRWGLGRGQEVCIVKHSYPVWPPHLSQAHLNFSSSPERSCDTLFLKYSLSLSDIIFFWDMGSVLWGFALPGVQSDRG